MKPIEQYLARYSEAEAKRIGAPPERFGHVLVLPALDESELLLGALTRIPPGDLGGVLTILVINAPEGHAEVQERSSALITALRSRYRRRLAAFPGADWLSHPEGAILLLDRASSGRGLPGEGGVGVARKVGCDVALELCARGHVESPWIHCTDADATLPGDYFARLRHIPGIVSAALYPYWHECESDADSAWAIKQYEVFLRYYELGLKYAGSPYAFQTLGSTIAIRALSYAQVRGFPKRSAAEDFYLLNKAAKVGSIVRLLGAPILLKGRASNRVPFGTGRSVLDLREKSRRKEDYLVYSPVVFDYLKIWLSFLNLLDVKDRTVELDSLNCNSTPAVDGSLLRRALDTIDAKGAIEQAKSQSTSSEALRRRLGTWFDAFQTLKFIHRLTDTIDKVPLWEALQSAIFMPPVSPGDLDGTRRTLAELALSSQDLAQPIPPRLGVDAKTL